MNLIRVKEYIIVECNDLDIFENEINNKLKEGYYLYGELKIYENSTAYANYVQVMIKK